MTPKNTPVKEKSSTITLDDIDLKILRLLQANANLTTKEIAMEVDLSNTPTYERIRRMENDGFIKQAVTLIDNHKLGLSLEVYCHIGLKEHNETLIKHFERDIDDIPEIMECHHVAGQFDYLLKVVTTDMIGYRKLITDKIAAIGNIGTMTSSFVMKSVKKETAYPI